ncbi:MAG: hypothetical protein HZB16_23880 [Armatimonadetes bacterium]|nr:hypothetical protein [Armatimonadota bacterium]
MGSLSSVLSTSMLIGYLQSAARGLVLAIPVALLFEVGGWLARGWLLKRLAPTYSRDAGREPAGRARRRRQLRDYTMAFARIAQNAAALLVIFALWRFDPVAIALVAVTLAVIARGPLADAVATWSLLVDDALAPGDVVCLNQGLSGTVAECGPRRIKLVDDSGRAWWIRCSEVGIVQHLSAEKRSAGADGVAGDG